MYADTITGSMRRAIAETNRRRTIQQKYNEEHGITPHTVEKDIRDVIAIGLSEDDGEKTPHNRFAAENGKTVKKDMKTEKKLSAKEKDRLIEDMTKQMKEAAKRLDFELAAYLRDRIHELRRRK